MANSTMGVRLSEDTQHRLEALGKARDRTPHYLMKSAVERFLEVEEALEAERQLVKSRWQTFELTGEAVDHADVKAWAASLAGSGTETN
jgi:predicted transcriptional regulator